MEKKFQTLLYYKYTKIENPETFVNWHKKVCEELGLKGRVIIAKEGLNGTLEGTVENTERYCDLLVKTDFGDFRDMVFKRSESDGEAFPKLKVKERDEIVSLKLGEDDLNPNEITGTHLLPEELREWFKNKKKFHVVDMRNEYEFAVGRFENSIDPKLQNFRDLPKVLPELEKYKDETVLTVCTGGVRCEKASGYLKKKGFKDVYQLDGGIVKYMEKYPGEDFLGSLYVFDNRVVMNFDEDVKNGLRQGKQHQIIGKCIKCGAPSENYTNVIDGQYRKHVICCEKCVGANKPLLTV